MDIQRKCFEESNNVNPDWSFKFDEELQQYIALDSEMELQVDEFNEHWDTFRAGWQAAKAQAVPEATSVGDELQSWVAVNSFAASDAVGDFPIIDANALAEVIEKLTGASQ
ncbi:hypothetical protein 7F8_33 [uncultured Caudovirales phage]|uniref:Uncharacterized protein n=1 Tax=uncultured Caudovirales phage TaxID=2100421 RepID=A0A2H4J3E7_9CAUD|nr:hypothetical protein 7AX4_31 [uncultured Caudovirales phage]ASN70356.1 hypothetical protein 8AX11_33 [uncultured Caudovirales phage]ASN70415.1 hypothetical protein 7F8_33 [uncultured Caudovirales phage]